MRTTTLCVFVCLLWATSSALDTLLIGDYITPPFPARTIGWDSGDIPRMLFDSAVQHNYFNLVMGPNGNGIVINYDQATRVTTGTLILKNTDGTYKTIALPFNCSETGGYVFTDGKRFQCGLKVFSLSSNNAIQSLQEYYTGNRGVFTSSTPDNAIYTVSPSDIGIWTNTTGEWKEESRVLAGTMASFYTVPIFTRNTIIVPVFAAPNGYGVKMFRQREGELYWTLEETLAYNLTDATLPDKPIAWDGGNTIIVGHSVFDVGMHTLSGQIQIFRKENGAWSLNKVITSEDLGLPVPGGFGIRLFSVDENTFIVHAVGSYNLTTTGTGGLAFALEKVSNDWVITKKFVQKNNEEAYLVGVTNYDKSDGRLYFVACNVRKVDSLRKERMCGIKYAVWDRAGN